MAPVVLINPFEVPPEADEPFIAGWERARDFLSRQQGFLETALHRSLVPEATFRFVNLAEIESVDAWRRLVSDPVFPGRDMPFPAHPGLYEVHFEDERTANGGVVLINAFDVPEDAEEATFVEPWRRARDFLVEQPGYLGTQLHCCIGPADFRFVNVAFWESPDAFAAALRRPEFREVASEMPYRGHSALYEVIRR